MTPIKIDLRTALASIPDDITPSAHCTYTAPCIIGRMMTPEERRRVATTLGDGASIHRVIANGLVEVPVDQTGDIEELQRLNDCQCHDGLTEAVARLKEKYA